MLIKRTFYDRNTLKVARDLVGCYLVREHKGKIIRGMIVETEAYRGEYDLACHASKGRTGRTEVMYGQAGRAYIYLVYGMHHMLNIVTESKNFPAAVLVRGVRIIQNSKIEIKNSDLDLDGPGKLTKFFHIDRTLNRHDMTSGKKIWIEYPERKKRLKIIRGPRIGVGYARQCAKWRWNFRIEQPVRL